jgi:hypothetical protein
MAQRVRALAKSAGSSIYLARLGGMRKIVLVWIFIILASTPAAARWFHTHHHHRHHGDTYSAINPEGQNGYTRERAAEPQRIDPHDELGQQSRVPVGRAPTEDQSGQQPSGQSSSSEENTAGDLMLPPDWQRQPADPNWQGQRFLSPDGTGSFSAFIAPVAQESTVDHIKGVAFRDGEQITKLRGGRGWIEVAGFKGDRIFYRKAVLACGGTSWHEVAFEHAAEAQGMNGFVDNAAAGVEMNRDKGCAAAVASGDTSSNSANQSPTDPVTNGQQ